MKRQGTDRDQGSGVRDQGSENLPALLRKAMPPVREESEAVRDLWPMMQARLKEQSSVASGLRSVPWFDWALAGGVALMAVAFPAAIPVLLYYL